jgi:phage terminase large subunit-like protein
VATQSARFEAGQVHLLKQASWLSDFLHELFAFPHARHDDQIDSVSQFLKWAEMRGRSEFVLGMGPKVFVDGRPWHNGRHE